MSTQVRIQIIYTVFISTITTSLLISAKITTLLGLTFTVGGFAYAVTFACTDIISECFGKSKAKQLILLGFFGYLAVLLFTTIAILSPPAEFWAPNQDSYRLVLGMVPRIIGGSVAAYLISQLHDVWSFHFWKGVTHGKYLWLRNNLSTMSSQFIDTIVFITIAFAGTMPTASLLDMVIGQYLLKLIIAAIDTPFIYLGVRWMNKGETAKTNASNEE